MTPTQTDLWRRLEAFDIDDGTPALTFAARLGRENGWPRDYADRVVAEYKRFLYLAASTGHVVTPSEQVDQAWHLHLAYTKSYWDGLCKDVLGRPLHHNPTEGGPAEAAKHHELYRQTLVAYRAAFGNAPPADVWPAVETRFGTDLEARRVNTAENVVVPVGTINAVLWTAFAGAFVGIGLANPKRLAWIAPLVGLGVGAVAGRALRAPPASRTTPATGSRTNSTSTTRPTWSAAGAARSRRRRRRWWPAA